MGETSKNNFENLLASFSLIEMFYEPETCYGMDPEDDCVPVTRDGHHCCTSAGEVAFWISDGIQARIDLENSTFSLLAWYELESEVEIWNEVLERYEPLINREWLLMDQHDFAWSLHECEGLKSLGFDRDSQSFISALSTLCFTTMPYSQDEIPINRYASEPVTTLFELLENYWINCVRANCHGATQSLDHIKKFNLGTVTIRFGGEITRFNFIDTDTVLSPEFTGSEKIAVSLANTLARFTHQRDGLVGLSSDGPFYPDALGHPLTFAAVLEAYLAQDQRHALISGRLPLFKRGTSYSFHNGDCIEDGSFEIREDQRLLKEFSISSETPLDFQLNRWWWFFVGNNVGVWGPKSPFLFGDNATVRQVLSFAEEWVRALPGDESSVMVTPTGPRLPRTLGNPHLALVAISAWEDLQWDDEANHVSVQFSSNAPSLVDVYGPVRSDHGGEIFY